MSQKILITGGAGFIGSNFVHYWLKQHPDDSIVVLDALTYAGNRDSLADIVNPHHYQFIKGDIRNSTTVAAAMADVDVVVHFAAESHVDRSILEPSVFIQTNVLGTQVLLEAALENNIKRFHHISTDEVFGSLEFNSSAKFTETTQYDPRSPYSASKAASDHIVRAYGHTYGLPITISNCSNNYGEYHFPEKIIPLAITNILEGKRVPVYGDGTNVRDWLYVQDHCRAIDQILTSGQVGETYLIGGLVGDVSNLELVKNIIKLMGASEDIIEMVKDRPGHDRRYAVDWSKINRELGWSPSVTLDEGLKRTIEWYSAHESWWKPLKERNQAFFHKNYGSKTTQKVA